MKTNSWLPYPLALVMLLTILLSCSHSKKQAAPEEQQVSLPDTAVRFADLHYIDDFVDLGSVVQGEIVSTSFRFTNKGNIPLVVKHIIPGCGCTKVKVSKEILKPNEEAVLEVTFESAGWSGLQYKSVTLRTNSPIAEKAVTIKANVIVK